MPNNSARTICGRTTAAEPFVAEPQRMKHLTSNSGLLSSVNPSAPGWRYNVAALGFSRASRALNGMFLNVLSTVLGASLSCNQGNIFNV